MPTKTRHDLVKRALQKLRIVSANEEPNAEDAALVSDIYATLRLELAARGIAGMEAETVPQDSIEAMAGLLAVLSSADFGIAMDDMAESRARKRLYAITGVPYSGEPVQANYF